VSLSKKYYESIEKNEENAKGKGRKGKQKVKWKND
jgi:hypothetical protein